MSAVRCRDCDRPLRSQEARETGYGSKCVRKHRSPKPSRPRTPLAKRASVLIPGQTALDLTEPETNDA